MSNNLRLTYYGGLATRLPSEEGLAYVNLIPGRFFFFAGAFMGVAGMPRF